MKMTSTRKREKKDAWSKNRYANRQSWPMMRRLRLTSEISRGQWCLAVFCRRPISIFIPEAKGNSWQCTWKIYLAKFEQNGKQWKILLASCNGLIFSSVSANENHALVYSFSNSFQAHAMLHLYTGSVPTKQSGTCCLRVYPQLNLGLFSLAS